MSKSVGSQTSFIGGISFNEKEGVENSYAFGRAIDHRSDPKAITLNPRAEKDSGSFVIDLPMWGARACDRTFFYDLSGNIYQLESGTYSLAHTAADSSGNGMTYFTQDRSLLYAQDTTFGRLLDACTAATFYDDFKGSEGGAPTNTKSLDLELASSQYASRADTSSTSITSDLTVEAYLKLESLPATDEIRTIVSKWDENTNLRSYKMDITTETNFFGDGGTGAFTNSTTATDNPHDANCTGTSSEYTLTTSNPHASFSPSQGDRVAIVQMRGTNAGLRQFATVQSWSSPTLTLKEPLTFSPVHSATASVANKAQVVILKQYTNYTVNGTLSCKAWDGLKGGIIGGYGSGTLSGSGTLNLKGKGFTGGTGYNLGAAVGTGEGTGGAGTATGDVANPTAAANGNGGGSSRGGSYGASGASGGNGTVGTNGAAYSIPAGGRHGLAGLASGSTNLVTIAMGGGAAGSIGAQSLTGASGGGIGLFFFKTVNLSSLTTTSNGNGGTSHTVASGSGASGGAGGSLHYKCQTMNFGTSKTTATGGTGGTSSGSSQSNGVVGGSGRIHVDYLTSVTGTTSPNYSLAQDSTLGSSDGYSLRLSVSSDGTAANSETYTQEITNEIDIISWARWAVTWDASASTAKFYKNGVLLGTKTGSLTAIDDNTSKFAVGTSFNSVAGAAENFYDGLMDDVRLWNDIRTANELVTNNDQILYGTETNLIYYGEFESDLTDSQTSGNNDLTGTNTPTYSDDVPFSGVTTRADQDQLNNQTGQTYTLATSISEAATHRQTFVPAKDPQKSIELDINTVGTGNWTLTVHDALNREVAALTVANAQLHTGVYEFIFASVWRPVIGASYHFHVTSSVADGVVVTGTTVDLETVRYWSHYQFLVSDAYHPMEQFLDFVVIGNERYLAKFEAGDSYEPHQLTFSSGWRVRATAFWREFIAIGCWKGTDITDFDEGRIFFWDGVSDTFNHSIPVPEGGINAMFGTQDVLFIVAGYSGEILIYTGGGAAQKYNKIPKVERDKYMEVAPGAINMWRSNIHFGVGLNTDSEVIHKGAYTIGTAQRQYPTSLGFDYPTSLGDQTSSSVKVGLIYPSGQDLFIGWRNSNTYGIDKVSVDNNVYGSGTVELLIRDMESISKLKYPLVARADFEPLKSGESINIKYKADREDTWKESDYEDTENATNVRLRIPERMKEIQVASDLKTTVSTSPKLLGITIEAEMEDRSGRRT